MTNLLERKRTNSYSLDYECVLWLAEEAKKQDTSASRLLNIIIKGKMNDKTKRVKNRA